MKIEARRALLVLAVSAGAGWALAAASADREPAPEVRAPEAHTPAPAEPPALFGDPYEALTELGYAVTGGAAPGYVADGACALCHADLARSYAEVGMARSFYRPRAATAVEDFDAGYYHAPSQRHYRMLRDGDRYLFRRYQLDAAGEPINVYEQAVDWVVGSGNHSRVYLYRTAAGELYELPLAWYTQQGGRWGMAPGFEPADHQGVLRQVRRECMFCHNAYPDVPAGSDDYRQPHLFPADLPEGIGCQRCHGPGARHAALALTPGVDAAARRAAVVNPGRLAPRLRDSVCYGCHLQPTILIPRVRRFGRADYSFRPGEALEDYLYPVDVTLAGRSPEERFDINHHPYRLQQSACFTESAGALSCLTCHDPHRKVPPAGRAAHYRAACLGCHAVDALPAVPAAASGGPLHADPAADCTACHMPERRPQDVVEVTMTDHRIRVVAPGADLAAPIAKNHDPEVTGLAFHDPERAPTGFDAELYLSTSAARLGNAAPRAILDRMAELLASPRGRALAAPDPWFDLAAALARQRRYDLLPPVLDALERRDPATALVPHWRGVAHFAAGDRDAAVAAARTAVERRPHRAEMHYNLGAFLAAAGRHEEAVAALDEALRLRPNLFLAWFHRGRALRALERGDEAVVSLRRALEVEPAFGRGYLVLAGTLAERGETAEARRYLEHASRVMSDPEPARRALAALGND